MTQLLLVYLESLEIFCFEKRKIWPVLLSVFIFVNVKVGFFSILGFPYSYFQIGWYESCFCKIKGNHSSWKIKKKHCHILWYLYNMKIKLRETFLQTEWVSILFYVQCIYHSCGNSPNQKWLFDWNVAMKLQLLQTRKEFRQW